MLLWNQRIAAADMVGLSKWSGFLFYQVQMRGPSEILAIFFFKLGAATEMNTVSAFR